MSNTIMTGELQRITIADAKHGGANNLSHDGWAVGGDATGFTTGYGGPAVQINGQPTPLMNNGFFQSPGSDHAGGATSDSPMARCGSCPRRAIPTSSP